LPVYQAAYQRHADPTIRQDLASAIGTYDTPEAQAVCQLHFPACNPWHGRSRWLVIGPPFHAQAWLAAHPERAPELETAATRCIDDYLAYIEPHAHNCLEVLALTNWPEAQRRAEVLKSTSAAESIRGIAAGLKRFPSADSFRAHVLTLGLVNTPVQAVSAENALFENQRSIWPQDEEGEVRIERLASLSEGLLEARFERRTLGGELVIEAWFRGEHWRVQDSFASEPWVSIGLLNAMTKRNKSTDRFALTSQGMVVVAPEMALRAADAEEILPLQRRIPAESVSVIPVPPEY